MLFERYVSIKTDVREAEIPRNRFILYPINIVSFLLNLGHWKTAPAKVRSKNHRTERVVLMSFEGKLHLSCVYNVTLCIE